ncbi:MAG: glycosyltransferase family 87 protein [Chitinophagaceae bacterium]
MGNMPIVCNSYIKRCCNVFAAQKIVIIWLITTIVTACLEIQRGLSEINNFLIYRGVFFHTLWQQPLYIPYPESYADINHYGPAFSIFIAPFAILPINIGCLIWCMANATILFYAFKLLFKNSQALTFALLFCVIELSTAIHSVQFNPSVAAFIILSFVLVNQKKDGWATFFIAAGFLIKLYGIAALVFFVFSSNKKRFVLSFIGWLILLISLPMIFSSPAFILQSYIDWAERLVQKNQLNIAINSMQDISAGGLLKRCFGIEKSVGLWVLATGALIYATALIQFKKWKNSTYRHLMLALSLIAIVIFSSSAESPTYIIAITGVVIWFASKQHKNSLDYALLIFVLVFTSISTTDIFPASIRSNFIIKYSIKALPCVLVYIKIVFDIINLPNLITTKPLHND